MSQRFIDPAWMAMVPWGRTTGATNGLRANAAEGSYAGRTAWEVGFVIICIGS